MPLWGKSDAHTNSVSYAVNQFGVTANSSNRETFYGNTTVGAFRSGIVAGQFAVDSTEIQVTSGALIQGIVTNAGSGYTANVAITLSGGGGSSGVANAQSNATGRIAAINIETAGSGYETAPTIVIAAPPSTTFNANTAVNGANVSVNASTGVNATANTIILGGSYGAAFTAGDKVSYAVAAGNTAIGGLTANTEYFISFANTTDIAVTATSGGANIDLTAGSSETGHYVTGPLNFIALSSAGKFASGDQITYANAAGNTAIGGLTNGTTYLVDFANSTVVAVKSTTTNTRIALTKGLSQTGHSLTGQTATGALVVGGAENTGASAGWNIRTVGTGGRAGRVQYECLVAMRNISTDGSDDSVLPDSNP